MLLKKHLKVTLIAVFIFWYILSTNFAENINVSLSSNIILPWQCFVIAKLWVVWEKSHVPLNEEKYIQNVKNISNFIVAFFINQCLHNLNSSV